MASETFILVASRTEPQARAYVFQGPEHEALSKQLDFDFLSVWKLEPGDPALSHDEIEGCVFLNRVVLQHPRRWFDNQTVILGNELRKLSKDQAMQLLDDIERKLRKAVSECAQLAVFEPAAKS